MKRGLLWGLTGLVLLGLFAVGGPVFCRTLDDVIAAVEKGAANLKDVKGTQVIKITVGNDLITAENDFIAKTPNKFKSTTRIPIPGKKTIQKVITVCDGNFIWQHVLPPEEEKIIKMNLTAAPGLVEKYQKKFMSTGYGVVSADSLLKLAGADYDIKVTGTARSPEMEMDILEGTLKKEKKTEEGPGGMTGWNLPVPAKIEYLVGVKDGFIYQTRGYNKTGKLILEISYRNLKFNTGVKDSVFVFTPPKGVEIFEASEIVPGLIK